MVSGILASPNRLCTLSLDGCGHLPPPEAFSAQRTSNGATTTPRPLWTAQLDTILERTGRIIAQTVCRLSGTTPDGATRIVSLHDPDARPIVKGRLGKPIEFGYEAQVVDNLDGIVVDHSVHVGNPRDDGLLVPAVKRIIARFGRAPRAVTADRGYSNATMGDDLTQLGVRTAVA